MKFVEDFRDKYKNEEIWILGSGSSLDDLPDDFFDKVKNRTSIAINWSIIGFPQCTYWLAGHPEIMIYMQNKRLEIFKKSILLLPLVAFHNKPPLNEKESLKLLGPYKNDPIFLRWHFILGNLKRFKVLLNPTVKCIMKKQTCRYICLSTSVHYAIQIAVVFGAKRISLVGCEATLRGGKYHAKKRGMQKFCFYPGGKDKVKPEAFRRKFAEGTRLLAQAFKPHGIKICRYFPKEGYKDIV